MPQTREGAVTLRGNPKTLVGPEIGAGQPAPEAQVVDQSLGVTTVGGAKGQTQILLAIPSLDTPVCSLETKKFNDLAADLAGVAISVISMDLPFAQKRWCGAEGVERVRTLSDHRLREFGEKYGVLIQDLGFFSRAAFVVDPQGKVVYAEYVPEVAEEPNYDAVVRAARQAAG
jgi:thiol peroxidase